MALALILHIFSFFPISHFVTKLRRCWKVNVNYDVSHCFSVHLLGGNFPLQSVEFPPKIYQNSHHSLIRFKFNSSFSCINVTSAMNNLQKKCFRFLISIVLLISIIIISQRIVVSWKILFVFRSTCSLQVIYGLSMDWAVWVLLGLRQSLRQDGH